MQILRTESQSLYTVDILQIIVQVGEQAVVAAVEIDDRQGRERSKLL